MTRPPPGARPEASSSGLCMWHRRLPEFGSCVKLVKPWFNVAFRQAKKNKTKVLSGNKFTPDSGASCEGQVWP